MVFLSAWSLLAGVAAAQKPAGQDAPQTAAAPSAGAPQEVLASAMAAVEKLGSEVSRGNYGVAIERMNPLWKDRLAKQTPGGMAEIEKQIASAAKRMTEEGVSVISSVPHGMPKSFEVVPGTRIEKVDGKETEVLIYTKWLVLVPTLTKYRLLLKGDPKPVFIEKVGYQVAVSEKGKNSWSFIDGSGLTVNALRRLYVTLPQDLELPPIEERKASENR